MPGTEQHTRRIFEKLQQLLKQYTFLQKENEKLKNELAQSKNEAKQRDEHLQLLELRLEVLKAAKGEMTEDEKKSFEKKISLYLKEIDKCIALLNE